MHKEESDVIKAAKNLMRSKTSKKPHIFPKPKVPKVPYPASTNPNPKYPGGKHKYPMEKE